MYDCPNWVTGTATFSVKSSYQYPGVECLNSKDLLRLYPLSLIPLHLTAGALFLYSTLASSSLAKGFWSAPLQAVRIKNPWRRCLSLFIYLYLYWSFPAGPHESLLFFGNGLLRARGAVNLGNLRSQLNKNFAFYWH